MATTTGDIVYMVFHSIYKEGVYEFADFQGAYHSKEKAEEAISANTKIKGANTDCISTYFSKDRLHRWQINTTTIL